MRSLGLNSSDSREVLNMPKSFLPSSKAPESRTSQRIACERLLDLIARLLARYWILVQRDSEGGSRNGNIRRNEDHVAEVAVD